MPGWFKKLGLVLLAGVMLSGCANNPKPEIEGGLTDFADLVENPEKFQGKEVVLYGQIILAMENVNLYDASKNNSDHIFISMGKITWNDPGFKSKKVIIKGNILWIDCTPDVVFQSCGTYLTDYYILWIK